MEAHVPERQVAAAGKAKAQEAAVKAGGGRRAARTPLEEAMARARVTPWVRAVHTLTLVFFFLNLWTPVDRRGARFSNPTV